MFFVGFFDEKQIQKLGGREFKNNMAKTFSFTVFTSGNQFKKKTIEMFHVDFVCCF